MNHLAAFFSQAYMPYENYNTYPYNNSSDYYYYSDSDAGLFALTAGMFFFLFFIVIASYVLHAFLLGRIFKKAGVEQWKAWVPVYNNWILLELGGQQGFWAVLAFVPFVNIVSVVFLFMAMYNIGLKLGKEGAFVLLAIFFPTIWMIWLAFDKSTWKGAKVAKKSA